MEGEEMQPNVGQRLMSLRRHKRELRALGITDEYGTQARHETWGWTYGAHILWAQVTKSASGWRARQVWSTCPGNPDLPVKANVLGMVLGYIRDGQEPALKITKPT